MNSRQRRVQNRLLARHGVTVEHFPGWFYPWGPMVGGEPVLFAPPRLPIWNRFRTKAAAIRCGVAHASAAK